MCCARVWNSAKINLAENTENDESGRNGKDSDEANRKNEEEEAAGFGVGAIPKTKFERVHRLDGDGLGRDKPNLEKDKSACGSCEGEVRSNQSGLQSGLEKVLISP